MKIGPNEPCCCGSGKKFKKCCGPRGGLTEIQYAEEQARYEDRMRTPRRRSSGLPLLGLLAAGFTGYATGPGPAPPTPPKRGRRKPR